MATATPPVSAHAVYPAQALEKLFAPPEAEQPADKLRRLLHEARDRKSFLHTAGAYDAFTAAIMTRLGFKALYGSGWQLAATKSMFPDIGVYASHDMVKLVHEMWMGIEGARNTHYYDTDGKEVLEAPPAFVDMEAGFGGPTQTFTLAVELIRARAGGVHLENQDPSNRTCGHIVNVGKQKRNKVLVPRKDWLAKLKAIKAASQATGVDVVIIARTDSIDGALPDREPSLGSMSSGPSSTTPSSISLRSSPREFGSTIPIRCWGSTCRLRCISEKRRRPVHSSPISSWRTWDSFSSSRRYSTSALPAWRWKRD
jgi:hypothetical protein